MYWRKLYQDFRLWRKFSKIAKENRSILEQSGLRVDMLGRIYTILNCPPEVSMENDYVKEAWALKSLKPFNDILMQIGLATHAFPEVRKVKEPGTDAFLVFLYPELETFSFLRFFGNLGGWFVGFLILRAIYRVLNEYNVFEYLYKLII